MANEVENDGCCWLVHCYCSHSNDTNEYFLCSSRLLFDKKLNGRCPLVSSFIIAGALGGDVAR